MSCPLVIIDRDGVINYDSDDFIKSPDEWEPIPGSLAAIARLYQGGWRVVVASNQSGVGRGLFSEEDLEAIHRRMRQAVEASDGGIDGIYYCPHHPNENCVCRKPLPGLLDAISRDYETPLRDVWFIGDSLRDVEAARAAGAVPVLVLSGNGQKARQEIDDDEVAVYDDLAAAADALLASGS